MSADANEREGHSAIILVVLLIAVGVYGLLYGLQTLVDFEAHQWSGRDPGLSITPQTLAMNTAPATQTTHLEFFNYQCEAPWKGPAKSVSDADYTDSTFSSGATVRVYPPEAQADVLQTFKGEDLAQQQHIAAVFGPQPFVSNYDFYDAVYSASPAQASPFMPRVESERVDTLLLWKMAFDTELPGGVFRFESDRIRGLQFGDPARTQSVILRAFNERDRQFKIQVTMAANSAAKLTQNDINQIITTLKPVPLPGE
ncbi:MAG: hypothetical protein WA755_04380 [Candidatus Acidiferrales bacterium]